MAESDLERRFWSKVDNSGDCWEWRGAISKSGYGSFGAMGKTMRAHRMAWILARGEIPAGMCVCHSCDNKKCVRPEHLFLGTQRDNLDDAMKKKTHCIHGHALSGDNLYIHASGKRECRECKRATQRRWKERSRADRKRSTNGRG